MQDIDRHLVLHVRGALLGRQSKMERKNKVMLAAAIGALVILVSSSAVRCAVSRSTDSDTAQMPPAEQQQTIAGEEHQEDEPHDADEGAAVSDEPLSVLESHAWQAKGDASKTVAFREGMFVETDETGVTVTVFTVTGETENASQKTFFIDTIRDGLSNNASSAVIIDGTEGSLTLTSDAFQVSKSYVQASTSANGVSIPQLDETYLSLIDGKSAELEAAASTWCKDHVPAATAISFDGEVYLDTNDNRVAATFHCDDAAKTIITVTYAAGTFTVAG